MTRYQKYEAAKAQYIARHPNASSKEYEKAMQHIARRFGV